jgi:hypothetical protein
MAQRWKLYNIGRGEEVALTTPYHLPPPDIRSMSPNAPLSQGLVSHRGTERVGIQGSVVKKHDLLFLCRMRVGVCA